MTHRVYHTNISDVILFESYGHESINEKGKQEPGYHRWQACAIEAFSLLVHELFQTGLA